jgi:vacuolar-type H+-ATPase subunit E/Vma4
MTTPESIVDAQISHLLGVVSRYEKENCQAILEQANNQAAKIVKEAYQLSHRRTARSLEEIRSQSFQDLKMAEAGLQTEARLTRHKLDEAFLEQAWEKLREALCTRWKDAELRKNWVAEIIDQASSALIAREWTVEHSTLLSADDVSFIQSCADEKELNAIEFNPRAEIDAGVRICAGGACIDGTIEGLLTQRDRIEEIFLASIYSKQMPDNATADTRDD